MIKIPLEVMDSGRPEEDRLVRGLYAFADDLHAHGPAAPAEGLPLPAGSSLDAEGFLIAG